MKRVTKSSKKTQNDSIDPPLASTEGGDLLGIRLHRVAKINLGYIHLGISEIEKSIRKQFTSSGQQFTPLVASIVVLPGR